MTLSYNLAYLEIILVHPTRHQSFANTMQLHLTQDLTPRLELFLKPVCNQATLVAYDLKLAAFLFVFLLFTQFIMSETKSVVALAISILVSFSSSFGSFVDYPYQSPKTISSRIEGDGSICRVFSSPAD